MTGLFKFGEYGLFAIVFTGTLRGAVFVMLRGVSDLSLLALQWGAEG